MSGMLWLPPDTTWTQMTLVYNRILERLADLAAAESPSLASRLLSGIDDTYCDLRGLPSSEAKILTRVVVEMQANAAADARAEFTTKNMIDRYLSAAAELRNLVARGDDRL